MDLSVWENLTTKYFANTNSFHILISKFFYSSRHFIPLFWTLNSFSGFWRNCFIIFTNEWFDRFFIRHRFVIVNMKCNKIILSAISRFKKKSSGSYKSNYQSSMIDIFIIFARICKAHVSLLQMPHVFV